MSLFVTFGRARWPRIIDCRGLQKTDEETFGGKVRHYIIDTGYGVEFSALGQSRECVSFGHKGGAGPYGTYC